MTRVIAFDIDGTLTEKPIRDVFRQLSDTDDFVGIITGRSPNRATEFVARFKLQADFEEAGRIKTVSLAQIRTGLHGHEEYIYIGNSVRDRVVSPVTGWKFIPGSRAGEVL